MAEGSPAFRVERWVFGGIGAFFVPWLIIYLATEYDRAGALLLAVGAVAMLAIAAYLTYSARGLPSRPSDRSAAVEASTPPLHVHDVSLWPLVMAAASTLLAFGLAFTVWVVVPAGLLFVFAILGYARETG